MKLGLIVRSFADASDPKQMIINGRINEALMRLRSKYEVDTEQHWCRRGAIVRSVNKIPVEIDAIVTIGGDGTVLKGARIASRIDVPVMGINAGHVGFLADVDKFEDIEPTLKAKPENRTVLRVEMLNGYKDAYCYAVNEMMFKTLGGSLISYKVEVDGMLAYEVKADGLIISTPTGSTAYSLAAGGPIIYPTAPVLAIVPMFPQTLSYRPLIVPATQTITVHGSKDNESIHVFCDGNQSFSNSAGRPFTMKVTAATAAFLRPKSSNYFDALRAKLNWHAEPGTQ